MAFIDQKEMLTLVQQLYTQPITDRPSREIAAKEIRNMCRLQRPEKNED